MSLGKACSAILAAPGPGCEEPQVLPPPCGWESIPASSAPGLRLPTLWRERHPAQGRRPDGWGNPTPRPENGSSFLTLYDGKQPGKTRDRRMGEDRTEVPAGSWEKPPGVAFSEEEGRGECWGRPGARPAGQVSCEVLPGPPSSQRSSTGSGHTSCSQSTDAFIAASLPPLPVSSRREAPWCPANT